MPVIRGRYQSPRGRERGGAQVTQVVPNGPFRATIRRTAPSGPAHSGP